MADVVGGVMMRLKKIKKTHGESLHSCSYPDITVDMMQTQQNIQPTLFAFLKLKFRVSALHLSYSFSTNNAVQHCDPTCSLPLESGQ